MLMRVVSLAAPKEKALYEAAVAQLVEHHVANVNVTSSSLVSRSNLKFENHSTRVDKMAGWQSGYAADCKSVDLGSTPGPASISNDILPGGWNW